MAIRKSSNSGIPFGNTAGRPASPSSGQPYFNGELQRLELYTGATYGWQNIVAETPGVTGYTGSVLETNSTNTITITGTNFASGATASLIGSDGTEYIATSTTVSNLTSIIAVFGAIDASKEPYDIKVTNPSNLYGVYYDILTVNDKPVWQTAAGSLGSFNYNASISVNVSATDEENNTLTYSSSNLPAWLSLNSSTGALTGTAPIVSSTTTYSFTVSASDGINAAQSRSFSITINALQVLFYAPFTSDKVDTVNNVSPTQDINGGIQSIGGYSGLRLNAQKTAFNNNLSALSILTGNSWTVEYWIYKNTTNSGATEVEIGSGGSGFYTTGLLARPGDPYWRASQLSWSRARTTGSWVHVAYVGDNGTLREYENGTQVNSSARDTAFSAAPTGIWLGGSQHTDSAGTSQTMDGYLRKFRVSSICRYPNGTSFTPSSVFPI